jgi:hypothetical protein
MVATVRITTMYFFYYYNYIFICTSASFPTAKTDLIPINWKFLNDLKFYILNLYFHFFY